MKLYHIDDRETRRAYLADLQQSLQVLSGTEWPDGFNGKGGSAWHDVGEIMRALGDDEGVILLDIELDDAGSGRNAETLRGLIAALASRNVNYRAFLDRTELMSVRGGPSTVVACHVLAAALALNRNVVVLTVHGFGPVEAAKLGVSFNVLPRDGDREEAIPETIEDVALTIWNQVSKSPYDVALRNWADWARKESVEPKFFLSSSDPEKNFHEISDWMDPGKRDLRPASEEDVMDEARRLLEGCHCGDVTIEFLPSLKLLKGAARNPKYLALAATEAILDRKLHEAIPNDVGLTPWLKCKVSAGRAALAIRRIRTSTPGNPKIDQSTNRPAVPQWTLELMGQASPSSRFKITQRASFSSENAASDARDELSRSPQERKILDERPNAGHASEACYWLREEAINSSMVCVGKNLILTFEFDALGV